MSGPGLQRGNGTDPITSFPYLQEVPRIASRMKFRTSTYVEGSEVIEISMPETVQPSAAVEAEQHRTIVENWESFAAAAYEGYRRFGAGAVVVEEDKVNHSGVRHPFLTHVIWYATSVAAWAEQGLLKGSSEWIEEQMACYDPRAACMFVFLREDAEPRVYFVESTLTPSQALTRIKALLN